MMDRPEILANKGYKSIADALREEGEAAGCKKMQPLLDAVNKRADEYLKILKAHGLA